MSFLFIVPQWKTPYLQSDFWKKEWKDMKYAGFLRHDCLEKLFKSIL